MTFVDGYFYMIVEDDDLLVQKLDDGSTAFSYPLGVLLTDTVSSLEHDGINFWSMHDITGGVSINRWQIENSIVKLKDTFDFTPNFDSDAFTVGHYHDTLASGVTTSGTVIYLNNYTSVVDSGAVLTLGPNFSNQYEEVNERHRERAGKINEIMKKYEENKHLWDYEQLKEYIKPILMYIHGSTSDLIHNSDTAANVIGKSQITSKIALLTFVRLV